MHDGSFFKDESVNLGIHIDPRKESFSQNYVDLNLQTVEQRHSMQSLCILSRPGFLTPNDITNMDFNPVVNKIQTFMSLKEKKNSGANGGNNAKLSFLSVRNLWTNPNAA
jgi:hypothetical protein